MHINQFLTREKVLGRSSYSCPCLTRLVFPSAIVLPSPAPICPNLAQSIPAIHSSVQSCMVQPQYSTCPPVVLLQPYIAPAPSLASPCPFFFPVQPSYVPGSATDLSQSFPSPSLTSNKCPGPLPIPALPRSPCPCPCKGPLPVPALVLSLSLTLPRSSPCPCPSPLPVPAQVLSLSLPLHRSSPFPCPCTGPPPVPAPAQVISLSLPLHRSSPCPCPCPSPLPVPAPARVLSLSLPLP